LKSLVSRRSLFSQGLGIAGLALARSAAAQASAPAGAAAVAPEAVVFVRLRGGADGLSLLVPYADPDYLRSRPKIAIKYASESQLSELKLQSGLALHPSLAPLRCAFADGHLGVIVGVGLKDEVRRHEQARRELEKAIAAAIPDKPLIVGAHKPSENGKWWHEQLRREAGPCALSLELDGWDQHVAQGDGRGGRFAQSCDGLVKEISALRGACDLSRVLIVVVTEFGRSLPETPLRGTDDGRASVMFVLGGPRRWGRILGKWPGLSSSELEGGRHVRPTLDVATAIARLARGEPPC
jgi:uncharacterized protein (DUF1501 family)